MVRAVRQRHGSGCDRQRGILRRELRPALLPLHPARRRLSEGDRRLGDQRQVSARPPLAHRPDPRQKLQGGAVGGAVRRRRALGRSGRAPGVAAQECRWADRVGHAKRLGRQDSLRRRRPPAGPAVAVRPGAARGAGVGLRLPEDRLPALGHRRRGPLRRPDPRRGLPQGARSAPRRPRHGGVPGRMRGAAAARRRVRERDADRNRCGRRLGRGAGAGSRRRLAQLLSPSHLAQRPRLPRRAPPTLRERGAGMGRARGRLGRSHSLFRQPPEAATRPGAPAPAHGSRRPRHGTPARHRGPAAGSRARHPDGRRRLSHPRPVALSHGG